MGASVIDHSCSPNAHVTFEGRNIVIRALTHIQSPSNKVDLAKHVKISYIDVMEHTKVRQRKLLDQYYFLCQCDRCHGKKLSWRHSTNIMNDCPKPETDQNLEDFMYSLRCQNCDEGTPILLGPEASTEDHLIPKCPKCEEKPSLDYFKQYLDIKTHVETVLNKTDIPFGEPKKCMKQMTGIFHPLHILYIKAAELAFEDCLQDCQWEEAIDYGNLCLNSFKKYSIGDEVSSFF